MLEWIGLLFELLFLSAGIYLYLFAIGKISTSDPVARQRMEDLRARHGWWIRLAALALTAIMLVNVVLHLRQLMA